MKRELAADPKAAEKTGVIFECLPETDCPKCGAAVPLADAKPLSSLLCPTCGGKLLVPGRVGGFLLHEHIGEGEMGAIYRATDESLKRDVAVKLVRGCHVDDPDSRERLQSEACAAGKLNHPRVAHVYALNFSNGHPYLVMELVTGQDFAQKLEREGPIDERVVLRMALDVAEGLSALNREGLVHGDIKPANIVLDRDGNAKLVDFGLSGMTRLDDRGALVGTPNYIAPELLRGVADTHRSDIYSLGATLYQLLSGRLTHDGVTSDDVLKARLFKRPVPLGKHARRVSLLTQKLVMRMLEPNPENRQPTSDVVAAEIRSALVRLDLQASATPEAFGSACRFFSRLGLPHRRQLQEPYSRHHKRVTVILSLVALIELLIAVRERSFNETWEWLSRDVAGPIKTMVLRASRSQPQPKITSGPVWEDAGHAETAALPVSQTQPPAQPETAGPVQEDFTAEASLAWQSVNLGEHAQGGSTLQMAETLIIQGTGTAMWKGSDSCRFVWTKASGNFAFSVQIKTIADNNSLALTGLMVKGADPAQGPGLLFGFLGSGELFLQVRQVNNKTIVVKRSGRQIPLPSYLKMIRRGKAFQACVSADGRVWEHFAACELELPSANTIGLAVSAQAPNTLATAKFANFRLLMPGMPVAAQTNGVSKVVREPALTTPQK